MLILGTQCTAQSQLYQQEGIECVTPNAMQQKIISTIINNTLAGKIQQKDMEKMVNVVIEVAQEKTLDGIVLGCTDLSVLAEQFALQLPTSTPLTILDPLNITVKKLTKKLFR